MINADQLLKSVTEDNPCGEDLSYDPSLQELETLMKGKPETQFSKAEPPDWRKLYDHCLKLFERSKDLRVAAALCVAAVKVDGLPGLREGLTALKGLLTQYWEPVYPRLDPSDNNDPLERMNIIAALATPRGTFGDPMRFLNRLREAPLTNSLQLGRFSLADLDHAKSGETSDPEQPPIKEEQIQAAFQDTKPEELRATYHAVADAINLVSEIDQFLSQTVGVENAPNLDLLSGELREVEKCLAQYLPAGEVPESPTNGPGETAPLPGAAPATQPIAGEIQSRQDVVRMLEKICQYYKRNEPSSPVPHLLQRAQRLAAMDFLQIIQDMCPDAETTVRTVTGTSNPASGE